MIFRTPSQRLRAHHHAVFRAGLRAVIRAGRSTAVRDARGQSLSVLAVVIMIALILTAGLVVDGGQQVDASSRAESVAAAAARVGSEAGATDALAGRGDPGRALAAAQTYLDGSPGVRGTVTVVDGRIRVQTEITVSTLMLSLIGIDTVRGHGDAVAELVGSGG